LKVQDEAAQVKKGSDAEKSKTASQLRGDLVRMFVVVCKDSEQHFFENIFVMKFVMKY
jgi:hypothetical protein